MTQKILILGAGRSASSLIDYLLKNAEKEDWLVTVADYSLALVNEKINGRNNGEALKIDVNNDQERKKIISKADIVISMLPADFHILVAETCVDFGVNLVTASYVSPEMKALDEKAKEKGVLILNECGLDPGIDHMSAMKVIDKIREEGHELTSFESFTGGLLAPSDEENPWEYKFTWNPRNVVMAGTGSVKFIQEGKYKFIPYHRLFRRTEQVHIPKYGYFEGYANRDSLKYLDVYNLRGIKTLYRGTFRRPGFCKAWDIFVQIGATDDTYLMDGVGNMTHRDFINSFLSYNPHDSIELKLAHYLGLDIDGQEMYRLKWLGIFDDDQVGLKKGTPAQILEHILKKKWTLNNDDRDMIVMWHKFDFLDNGRSRQIQSTMIAVGEDAVQTGMSKTVGLPMGIATKLILKGNISLKGVHIPIKKEIYNPILEELSKLGIELNEKEIEQS
ncbi:MAG: saccharopine dehydrogenase NADP-binding domain-containing protein [Cyclobacteriaceae bacterium]|nr:saccharopine dehydrogenase NADP-binding domain-containing protein [Cyclobacteriaceae bacterium]